MTTSPALQLAEPVEDDATELTDLATAVALVHEVGEDDETVATAPAGPRPVVRPRPAMVAVVPEVPDPAALSPRIPSADRPTPDLELLVLQQDNVRLLRENEAHQRRLDELRQALEGARRASREALEQVAHWKDEAAASEAALSRVASERDHYRSFAESGLWGRIRGCTHFDDTPPEADPEA